MKTDFSIHNLFWRDIKEFEKFDPHLSKLIDIPYVYHPKLAEEIPVLTPGIYILSGGRQVGKSTLLKLIIKHLLIKKNYDPNQIYYLPCDTIVDFRQLLFEIGQFNQSLKPNKHFIIFLDEITYVKEWTRAIKSLADAGFFNNGSVLITGSDTALLKSAMMAFPGRRGKAPKQDFHLSPLSFYEYTCLINPKLSSSFGDIRSKFHHNLDLFLTDINKDKTKLLQAHFHDYILTGGYLLAINDYAKNKDILTATYKTYIQWIIGDMLKRGKSEEYLREIISALLPRLSKQITWNNLMHEMSIEHHQTIKDYMDILGRMDVTFTLHALKEDKLRAAPKKAKKIHFEDPFIFHAMNGWIKNREDIFKLSIELLNSNSDIKNSLIEGTVASLFNRNWDSYYIKAASEVDIAIISRKHFYPIEIKNSLTLDRKGLKQILKYKRGLVGYSGTEIGKFEHLDVVPIPIVALLAS